MSSSPTASISTSRRLFTGLFNHPRVRSRYLDAPLLEERAAYLLHLLRQGVPRTRIKSTALFQIRAIKLLNIKEARPVHAIELEEAGSKWAARSFLRKRTHLSQKVCRDFTQTVMKWLTFIGLFIQSEAAELPFNHLLTTYLDDLRLKRVSDATMYNRGKLLSKLQVWLGKRHDEFEKVSLEDIDEFLANKRAEGWKQSTLRNACQQIRLFMEFCESQNWCKPGISRGIMTPPLIKSSDGPRGPAWKDVRRMLSVVAESPVEIRENAIISLCSIYAMRRSEIVQIRLNDFDWHNEIMTVRRAKRGGVQQFPIQYEVGNAILAYLKSARPKCSCRTLFTTIRTPFRPMTPNSVGPIVAKRMRLLNVKSQSFGPHALRHSCATRLLDRGFSLDEIADFLGHRGLHSVSRYAKYNPKLLRTVACFSLEGIR